MSHCDQVLSHLKAGNTITPIEALQMFGCFRLAARVCDLREKGHAIHTDIIKQNGKEFARYRLDQAQEKRNAV